jgi:hypothetical protein
MKLLSQVEVQQVSGGQDGDLPVTGVVASPLPYPVPAPVPPYPRLIQGPIGYEP